MHTFYSHGKLLLTAEYVVLDGAVALALPTKFGQLLTVEPIKQQKMFWQSIDSNGAVWFEDEFSLSNGKIATSYTSGNAVSQRLVQILNAASILNKAFLNSSTGYKITATLEFPNHWGLGSSSTLLNAIAQWANIDAFKLSNATFGGSGYDIACAQNNSAILYQLIDSKATVTRVTFKKAFQDQLFFVHLNRKQNSRESIKTYQDHKRNKEVFITKINSITSKIMNSKTIKTFNTLIHEHEQLIGNITNQTPIKKRLFADFKNEIKSLGGWNGDFVLATGEEEYVYSYFKTKGYNTILNYKDMIL